MLQQVVVAAGLWLVGVSALCVPLSAVGLWDPVVGTLVVLAVAWQSWLLAARVPAGAVGRATGVLLVAVAVAATVWLGATRAEQVLPRRDAGSNVQAAISLAETHRRVVPVPASTIGGAATLERPGVTLASPAFYEVGSASHPAVQPQFVIGPAAVYSLAYWVGGAGAILVVPPLLTGLTLLGFGLLVGRCVGMRWGPVAAALAALVFPVVHTGRSTLSEPLADLALVAALLALVSAAATGRGGLAPDRGVSATTNRATSERTAGGVAPDRGVGATSGAVAGLLVGATMLLRADALRETVLLTVVGALAVLQRRPWARPLLTWAWVGTAYALLAALWLSYRYLGDISGSLVPLAAGAVVVALGCAVVVLLSRRGVGMPRTVARLLPGALAALTALAGLVLASRPLWQVVRQSPDDPGSRYVAALQLREGVTVDGARTYAEHSVAWLAWWVGWPALGVALAALSVALWTVGSAWVAGRSLPAWSGPLLVAAGSTLLTLWRPGITPDHPWADRRILIALLLVVGLVVAGAAWLVGHVPGRVAGPAAASLVVLVLLVPTVLATWPHRGERVEAGSLRAVEAVCAALGPHDVALMVDSRAANEWPQVVRGQCGRPALSTTQALRSGGDLPATVRAVSRDVASRGGRLVLLAASDASGLRTARATDVRQVSAVTVQEDARLLEHRPDHLVDLPLDVWIGVAPTGPGAP